MYNINCQIERARAFSKLTINFRLIPGLWCKNSGTSANFLRHIFLACFMVFYHIFSVKNSCTAPSHTKNVIPLTVTEPIAVKDIRLEIRKFDHLTADKLFEIKILWLGM